MFNPKPTQQDLPLEQQLMIKQFAISLDKMRPEDVKSMALAVYESLIQQKVEFRKLLRHDWGL